MTKDDYLQIESSQRQHDEELEHQERMYAIQMAADFSLIPVLKPKITKDGNMFCVLYGENLQEGIAGFGETIHKAVIDFNAQFEKSAKEATDDRD
jgi:hypothetical protein